MRVDPENPDVHREKPEGGLMFRALLTPPRRKGSEPVVKHHRNGCISRTGYKLDAYSYMEIKGIKIATHRVIYAVANGCKINRNTHHVHHRCGNKGCINPEHLVLLTPYEHRHAHATYLLKVDAAKRFGTEMPRWIDAA